MRKEQLYPLQYFLACVEKLDVHSLTNACILVKTYHGFMRQDTRSKRKERLGNLPSILPDGPSCEAPAYPTTTIPLPVLSLFSRVKCFITLHLCAELNSDRPARLSHAADRSHGGLDAAAPPALKHTDALRLVPDPPRFGDYSCPISTSTSLSSRASLSRVRSLFVVVLFLWLLCTS
jgi:hypothetical protein